MAAVKRLETWDASQLSTEADVSIPTANRFSQKHDFETEKVPTGGKPKTVYKLTDEKATEIDREVSAFFQQVLELAMDIGDGTIDVRNGVEDTFEVYFPNVDFTHAESPTNYPNDVVEDVFTSFYV